MLSVANAIEHERAELLLETWIVRVDLAGMPHRDERAVEITDIFPGLRLVLIERELALRVVDERLLHRVVGHRLGRLAGGFESFAHCVNRVDAPRVVLDGPAVVLDSLRGVGQWRLRPQTAELLVDPRDVCPHVRIVLSERRERLGSSLEQSGQCLAVPLLAVQLGKALGRRGLRGIPVDCNHQSARGSVRVIQRHDPDVGRLGQPMARERGVARCGPDFLQQHRVGPRVRLPGAVGVKDGFLVVGVLDQTLN